MQSGAIGLGQGAEYTESGGIGRNAGGLGNSSIDLSRGASLTINETTGMTGAGQPISVPYTTPPPVATVPPAGVSNPAPLGTLSLDNYNASGPSVTYAPPGAGNNWWDPIPGADGFVSFWTGLNLWQQIAGFAAIGLIVVFFFHHRKT